MAARMVHEEIARSCGARVIDIPRKGYGSALMGAIEASYGKYVIMGDSDDSYDFSNLTDVYVESSAKVRPCHHGKPFQKAVSSTGAMPFSP